MLLHPLIRTLKGPKNLLELANVRIIESCHKTLVGHQNGREIQKTAFWHFFSGLTLSGPVFSVVRQARGGAQRPRCQKSRLTSTN